MIRCYDRLLYPTMEQSHSLHPFHSPPPQGVSNWHQLQRMLIKSILSSLGGSEARCNPLHAYTSSRGSGLSLDPNVMHPAEGYQLLLECEAVKGAHWAFRLYLARYACICVRCQRGDVCRT